VGVWVCGCVGVQYESLEARRLCVWVCGCVSVQCVSLEELHKAPIELSHWERIEELHRKRLVGCGCGCVGKWVCGCAV